MSQDYKFSTYDKLESIFFESHSLLERLEALKDSVNNDLARQLMKQLMNNYKNIIEEWQVLCEESIEAYFQSRKTTAQVLKSYKQSIRRHKRKFAEINSILNNKESKLTMKEKELQNSLRSIKSMWHDNLQDLESSIKEQKQVYRRIRLEQDNQLEEMDQQMRSFLIDEESQVQDDPPPKLDDSASISGDLTKFMFSVDEIDTSLSQVLPQNSPPDSPPDSPVNPPEVDPDDIYKAIEVLGRANLLSNDGYEFLRQVKELDNRALQSGQLDLMFQLLVLKHKPIHGKFNIKTRADDLELTSPKNIAPFPEDGELGRTIPSNPVSSRGKPTSLEDEIEKFLRYPSEINQFLDGPSMDQSAIEELLEEADENEITSPRYP